MASDESFVEYVRDQISEAGRISFRRMFGEYAVYCNGKVVALIFDNQIFVKATVAGREMLEEQGEVAEGMPFPGAKPWFLIEGLLDDPQEVSRLIRITADELPLPQPKKAKVKKAKE